MTTNHTAPRATTPRVRDLDVNATCGRHRYTYSRIARLGEYRVRARVERDAHETQSCAVAEVLAHGLTWTHLATEDTATWFPDTTPPSHGLIHCETELAHIADVLIHRAAAILLD